MDRSATNFDRRQRGTKEAGGPPLRNDEVSTKNQSPDGRQLANNAVLSESEARHSQTINIQQTENSADLKRQVVAIRGELPELKEREQRIEDWLSKGEQKLERVAKLSSAANMHKLTLFNLHGHQSRLLRSTAAWVQNRQTIERNEKIARSKQKRENGKNLSAEKRRKTSKVACGSECEDFQTAYDEIPSKLAKSKESAVKKNKAKKIHLPKEVVESHGQIANEVKEG